MRIARRLGPRLVAMVTARVPVRKRSPRGGEALSESFYIGPFTLCPSQRVMGFPS
jgi:hypothetical protein